MVTNAAPRRVSGGTPSSAGSMFSLPGGPAYVNIRAAMMRKLAGGAWKPGEALPSETVLAQEFGVAIGTLRRAVDDLVAAKMLVRQQGRGTFVAVHDRNRLLFQFFHVERRDGYKEYPDVRLVSFTRGETDVVAAKRLEMPSETRFSRIHNTLSLENKVVVFDDILLPEAVFPKLSEKRLGEREGTLYQLYEDEFKISVVRTTERARAAAAPAEVAKALGIARGAPVLLVERIAFAYHDKPVEFRCSWVNTAEHDFVSGGS
jgi:GntR family transcriptional regulator